MKNLSKTIVHELKDFKLLLQSVPATTMVFFTVSVVMMNLYANKELVSLPYLALDCGFLMSWLSFLCMDMLTKRFGAKAAIKLSLFAMFVNLIVAAFSFVISLVSQNWGQFYTYENTVVNDAIDATFGGTWYVLLGSTIAFIVSAVLNALINSGIGKLLKKDNFLSFATRSYISTLVAQFVDNLVFALIVSHVFFGWTLLQCITCAITGGVAELICEVIFSPIGYRVSKGWKRDGVGDQYLKLQKVKEN